LQGENQIKKYFFQDLIDPSTYSDNELTLLETGTESEDYQFSGLDYVSLHWSSKSSDMDKIDINSHDYEMLDVFHPNTQTEEGFVVVYSGRGGLEPPGEVPARCILKSPSVNRDKDYYEGVLRVSSSNSPCEKQSFRLKDTDEGIQLEFS
jgi:hypothetical protein